MREKTYRARLCLVQLASPDQIWLVEPGERLELTPIAELLSDPAIEIIVHAGRQDFEIFYERFGVTPARVFDVQLAAAFAGYGASLSYGRLVEMVTGVRLEKGESYTDWCRRPLTKAQLLYAADDVRFLLPIAERLKKELESLGRGDWLYEEMKSLEDEAAYNVVLEDVWRRVSGRGTLSSRHTSVLRELAHWREETAAHRDIPRGWVIKDATLVEIARKAPRSVGELKAIRGVHDREAERSGRAILSAIERGRQAPEIERIRPPSKSIQARARMISGLADALVRARCENARLATELVATRGELETLLTAVFSDRLEESEHRILQGWRRELAGDAVVALAQGKLAVRVRDEPPFVEEVRI